MTRERAAYHRLMLLAGLAEEYEQELDAALETEDPITAPVLDLAFCMSNLEQTVSVLYNYTLNGPVDWLQVYDMIMQTLRRQYAAQQLSAGQVCEILGKLLCFCDFSEPWSNLYTYLHSYELLDAGLISQEVFETDFRSLFLHGKQTDIWQLQKEHSKKKKKSFWRRFAITQIGKHPR